MENKLGPFLTSYIKSVVKDDSYKVRDAKMPFGSLTEYASYYILPATSASNFRNLESKKVNSNKTQKTFTYKETLEVLVRVDFHGSTCEENMRLFKHSFYQDKFNELFNESDFSFIGFHSQPQVKNLIENNDVKLGMTSTIKLQAIERIEDSSPMVKKINIKANIVKEL